MTELTPRLVALKAELMPAVRRDHQRYMRRHKLVRTSALALALLVVLAGSALAAGSALGIIDLGGGVTAAQVGTLPVWSRATGTFYAGTENGEYIYDIAGVGADIVSCGPAAPDVATYITAIRPLSQSDLQELIDPNSPSGITDAHDQALGITGEAGGCFPAGVVAGQLYAPQTASEAAAAQARFAANKPELLALINAFQQARQHHLQQVAVTMRGKRIIISLRAQQPTLSTQQLAREQQIAQQISHPKRSPGS